MQWRHVVLILLGLAVAVGRSIVWPFPDPSTVPVLVLIGVASPRLLAAIHAWYVAAPGVAVLIGGMLALGMWRVWIEPRTARRSAPGSLLRWPVSDTGDAPALVIGETHHPVEARESVNPEWLVIPERGLYTGVAIFGAVGSGKTSACVHPFASQLLGWRVGDREKRAAALVLEVKGDFFQLRTCRLRSGPVCLVTPPSRSPYWTG